MPPPAVLLQLPQPCAESWEAMTPAGPGRHCAACQQVVVDFTAMTDGELAAYLARPGQVPCGRFRASQLGRVLRPAARPVVGWRRWLGAVAALLGVGALTAPAWAQTRPSGVSRKQVVYPGSHHQARPLKPRAAKADPYVVRGEVAPPDSYDSYLSGAPARIFTESDTTKAPK